MLAPISPLAPHYHGNCLQSTGKEIVSRHIIVYNVTTVEWNCCSNFGSRQMCHKVVIDPIHIMRNRMYLLPTEAILLLSTCPPKTHTSQDAGIVLSWI